MSENKKYLRSVDAEFSEGVTICGISSLNADIYRMLNAYLMREEFQSFLLLNKQVHDEYVEYRYITLNCKYSLFYVKNEEFRERISFLCMDPRKQVALNFVDCLIVTGVSGLGGVHSLNLSGCPNVTDVSGLGGVHTLNLSRCPGITDVSGLSGVHTLNLSGCSGIIRECEWSGSNAYVVHSFKNLLGGCLIV